MCLQGKSADLSVDGPKKVRLHAYSASMLGAKKRCFNAALYRR